jgi:acetyltransferase-like isoleucine patch superfamily enzyme
MDRAVSVNASSLEVDQGCPEPRLITLFIRDLPDSWFSRSALRKRFTADSVVEFHDPGFLGSKRIRIQLHPVSARSFEPIHIHLRVGCMRAGRRLSLQIYLKGVENQVSLGDGVSGSWNLYLFGGSRVEIGSGSRAVGLEMYVNYRCSCSVGEDCMISENVVFQTGDGHTLVDLDRRKAINQQPSSIRIGDHCWLGRNSVVLASAREICMGSGSVLGLGSILTRTISMTSLAVGSPARVLRSRISWHHQQRLKPEQIAQLCCQFPLAVQPDAGPPSRISIRQLGPISSIFKLILGKFRKVFNWLS